MTTSSLQTRQENLTQALQTDHVLSLGQINRHYQLEPHELPEHIRQQHIIIEPTATTRPGREFTIATTRRYDIPAPLARHACGIAELRHALNAAPADWTSDAMQFGGINPDAIWRSPHGVLAAEYDSGAYNRTQLQTHAMRFGNAYQAQVWAVPSAARAATVAGHLAAIGITPTIIPVTWY